MRCSGIWIFRRGITKVVHQKRCQNLSKLWKAQENYDSTRLYLIKTFIFYCLPDKKKDNCLLVLLSPTGVADHNYNMLMKGLSQWVVQSWLASNQKLVISWSIENSEKYRIDEFFIHSRSLHSFISLLLHTWNNFQLGVKIRNMNWRANSAQMSTLCVPELNSYYF